MIWYEPVTEKLHASETSSTADGSIFSLDGRFSTVTLQIHTTASSTVNFEGSIDGTNYIGLRGLNANTNVAAGSIAASSIFTIPVTGINKFKARRSSGKTALTVTAVATPAPMAVLSS